MDSVTIRELRNNGGRVLDRVLRGEPLQVTRDGRPVAEIVPTRAPALTAEELIRRSRTLPDIDADRFRSDVDAVIDQRL
jgi:prevent-host-death family protein